MPQGKRKVNQPIATFMLYSVAFSDFAPEGCIIADSKQQNVTQPFSEGCHVQAALRRARKHRTTPLCTALHTSAQALRRKGLFWRIHTPCRQPCSPCVAQKRRTFPLGQRNSEKRQEKFSERVSSLYKSLLRDRRGVQRNAFSIFGNANVCRFFAGCFLCRAVCNLCTLHRQPPHAPFVQKMIFHQFYNIW